MSSCSFLITGISRYIDRIEANEPTNRPLAPKMISEKKKLIKNQLLAINQLVNRINFEGKF